MVERKLTSYPSFFRGRVQFACSKHSQKEANLEIQVENARFQRNARGVLVSRHVPGCNDLRSQNMAEKNADREDFRCANQPPRGGVAPCAALTSSFGSNNNDGRASLKQQKSLETITDTQDASKCY